MPSFYFSCHVVLWGLYTCDIAVNVVSGNIGRCRQKSQTSVLPGLSGWPSGLRRQTQESLIFSVAEPSGLLMEAWVQISLLTGLFYTLKSSCFLQSIPHTPPSLHEPVTYEEKSTNNQAGPSITIPCFSGRDTSGTPSLKFALHHSNCHAVFSLSI